MLQSIFCTVPIIYRHFQEIIMPLRAAYLILSVLALTGCYYESNTPLLSSMETIPITRLEQDGTHYYEQESGNEYLILEISNGALKIKPRSLSTGMDARSITATEVVNLSGSVPDLDGRPVYAITVDNNSGAVRYYPFVYEPNEGVIRSLRPSTTGFMDFEKNVSSRAELLGDIAAIVAERTGRISNFRSVSSERGGELIALDRAAEAKAKKSRDSASGTAKSGDPTPAPAPQTASPLFAPGSPSEADIRAVLQARLDAATSTLDAMGDACNTFRRDNNPIAALGCLATGGGAINSDRLGIRMQSLSLERCMAAENDIYLCRYRVRATGNAGGNPLLQMLFFSSQLGGVTDATFRRDYLGRWEVVRIYDRCTYNDAGANCTWTE